MSNEAQGIDVYRFGGSGGDELLDLPRGLVFKLIQEADQELEITANL